MKRVFAVFVCAAVLFCGCGKKVDKKMQTTREEVIPVIIDVDTGTDDAIALAMARKSEGLEVRGVTVVQGCVGLEQAGANTLAVCDHIGLKVPVALGAGRPLVGEPITDPVNHGESGLGSVELPTPKMELSELSASELIWQEAQACEGKLQIVALGPLTNVALALQEHPELKEMIARVVAACGEGGENHPIEFNAKNDPEALQYVIDSGVRLTIYDQQTTEASWGFDMGTTKDGRYTSTLNVLAEKYPDNTMTPLFKGVGKSWLGNYLYSVYPIIWLNVNEAHNDLDYQNNWVRLCYDWCRVTCDTSTGPNRGRTTFTIGEGGPVQWVFFSSRSAFDLADTLAQCYQ